MFKFPYFLYAEFVYYIDLLEDRRIVTGEDYTSLIFV